MPETFAGMQRRMHRDEVSVDLSLVRRLLADQFPHLRREPVAILESTGTVNAICRIGQDLYARLPRVAAWAESLSRELTWLPRLAPHLSLSVPTPIGQGRPTAAYPFAWAIYTWLDGSPYSDELVTEERQTALDLADFIQQLRSIDAEGAPRAGRAPLAELDQITRSAIVGSRDSIDAEIAIAAWEQSLEAPRWSGKPLWIHSDLLRPNLLLEDGKLSAVIDFGGVGAGDPAADIIAAWSVFGKAGREAFRRALGVDDDTWRRARGYALHQASMIIPYYRKTNPSFVDSAIRTVREVLTESAADSSR